MTANGLLQIAIFCAIIAALAVPLGIYMARVFAGERTFLSPVLRPVKAPTCLRVIPRSARNCLICRAM